MNEERGVQPERLVAPLTGLVPMLPVQSVERSAAFYALLGFAVGNRVPATGEMGWAWLYAPNVLDWRRGPNLMLTCSECVVEPPSQPILFYLYATDLVALRDELVRAGQNPGAICYPAYLPRGEFKLSDPDGYQLMLAQSDKDTP
jgi:hypothetical protein